MRKVFNEDVNEDVIVSSINVLQYACHKIANDHGFWKDEDELLSFIEHNTEDQSSTSLKFKNRIKLLFNNEKIALEMSELAERLECLRKNPEGKDEHCPEFFNVEIEIADLIIRALDFASRRNLRVGEALLAKMEYNKSRPFLHGKKF